MGLDISSLFFSGDLFLGQEGHTANNIGNSHLALFIDLDLVFLGIELTISK
jgi:hypothetical protein